MASELHSPPRPRLAFRVGVVGHRPNRLVKNKEPELRSVLRDLLSLVKDEVEAAWDAELYAQDCDRKTVLRAVSPLAEGADQLFAEQALSLGYSLCCILPFVQAEYEKDFTEGNALEADALTGFRELLARGRQQHGFIGYELDGVRADSPAAYGAAGRVLLNQSDLLIVIWDGQRLGKRGGTEEIFDEALVRGVPVVWIDAHNPSAWQIIDAEHPLPTMGQCSRASPTPGSDPVALKKVVESLLHLSPPEGMFASGAPGLDSAGSVERLKAFLAERKPRFSIAVLWGILQRAVGDNRCPVLNFRVTGFEEAVEAEWPRDRSTAVGRVVDGLRPFYAWPDKLAVLYANRYRSAFLAAFSVAAVAVGLALLPVGAGVTFHHPLETTCMALELVAIVFILYVVQEGRQNRWHERWLEYRMVAELVRHLRLVAPLGGVRPLPPIPAHWANYGQPSATWMTWYVRAVERDLGLPTAVVDKAHLSACLEQMIELLKGQTSFHALNAKRSDRIEHRLHWFGTLMLWLTLLACAVHFAAGVWQWPVPSGLLTGLTFCCAFFPALGAALAGIANQGEFLRVGKRSKAMQQKLESLLQEIEKMAADLEKVSEPLSQQYSPLVSTRASNLAQLLVHEVLDWRVVFLDRPLKTPT